MVKGTITFKARQPSRNSFCPFCKSVISFYHFELLFIDNNYGRDLIEVCSEECANLLLLLRGGRND